MDKFFSRLLLYLFLCSSFLPANNYFIHLSPAGVAEKENLLSASSLLSANKLFKAGGALFKKSVNLSLSADQFSDWLTLSVSEFHAENVLEQLIQDNLIDFYEPVGVFRVDQVYQDTQWYLETINIQNAWQVSTGIPEIIIGVIDTGIDYNHPDLRGGLWFNDAEYNGLPGVDDDNNGFIDDSLGWDFVDAPRLADGGDYLDPDNNPMDEYGSGHGTQIAGIISGQNINGDGIMGIAPGVKVMNLRAGTAAGYLEEDDVVNAVLYAVDNGVAVINMSFGDLVISRLLKDVLIYAHQQGVVLVGSAGNDASDHINYPAGLNEVISVGATAQNDYLASFSNYGNSVDLMAPGSGIPSTAVGGGYNEVTGTSFAAPMVSALAGLILSKNQDYDFNRVKNIMKTTAVEIPEESYDKYLGAGRIDAGKALQIPHGGLLEIASPRQNSSTSADTLWITGSAAHPAIKTITISYGIGIDPEEWLLIAELHHKQIINDTLAFLALKDFQEITISMNVTMNLINGENQTERIQFHIDRSPPVISSVNSIFLLDGEVQSVLVSFETDDITRARIYLKKEGETAIHGLESGYETQKHRFKIDRQQFSGTFLFKIEAGNESGLVSMDDNGGSWYGIPNDVDYAFYPFISKEWEAPPGYLLSKTTDINKNGIPEIVISAYDENNAFGPIEIYEYNAGRFDMIYQGSETAIPRDYGDINQNGLPDLLTGFGENSAIIEFSVQPAISAQIIWTDPLWSAAYGDTDEDGLFEIIGRKDNQYVVLEYRQNNTFEQVAELTNTTSGQNQYGMPNVVLVDMNGDGHLEIIFGDYDGDVVVYRNTGDNVYEQFGAYKTILPDVTELLTGISIESQNGLLYAGSHTGENMDYEHELDARYRAVEQIIYHNAGQQLISTDTSYYYGYRNTREYNSGLTINRLNGDIYLFASFFPDLYVSRFAENQLIPVWHYPQARSNTVLVGDFDADGSDEIVFNDGGKINGFSLSQQECPPAPYPIILNKADSVSITISWTALENNFYRIYRGPKIDNLTFYETCEQPLFRDDSLNVDTTFFYAVTSVDSSFPKPESGYSMVLQAGTGRPPKLLSAETVHFKQMILTFNEPVFFHSTPFPVIRLKNENRYASSVLQMTDRKQLLVTFNEPFIANTNDTVSAQYVYNEKWIELDDFHRAVHYQYIKPETEPYVSEVKMISGKIIELYFSESMRHDDLTDLSNYSIEPSGNITEVQIQDETGQSIRLNLSADTPPGNAGIPLYLVLSDIHSISGTLLRQTDKISLNVMAADLGDILVYPQPVRPHHDKVTFGNLPSMVKIVIFNVSGMFVREIEGETDFGAIDWDLSDSSGKRVASGVYIYQVVFENRKKIGKLAIVR